MSSVYKSHPRRGLGQYEISYIECVLFEFRYIYHLSKIGSHEYGYLLHFFCNVLKFAHLQDISSTFPTFLPTYFHKAYKVRGQKRSGPFMTIFVLSVFIYNVEIMVSWNINRTFCLARILKWCSELDDILEILLFLGKKIRLRFYCLNLEENIEGHKSFNLCFPLNGKQRKLKIAITL